MTARDVEGYRAFEATQWSLVDRAAATNCEVRREALQQLLSRYLPALRAHLLLRRQVDPTTADDLLQGFVLEKILERDLLQYADSAKGKFRTFLLTSLENYVSSARRKQTARKRAHEALVTGKHEAVEQMDRSECDVFDVAWARQVFASALEQMRMECFDADRAQIWQLFERRIVAPLLQGIEPADYGALLAEFGFASPEQAANALVTAKRHFKRVLNSIIGEYEEGALDVEMARLCQVLSQPGALEIPDLSLLSESTVGSRDATSGRVPAGAARLASLLSGQLDDEIWRAEDWPSVLQHQLEMPLISLLGGEPIMWARVNQLCHQVEPAIRTLRDLLVHSSPPIELLQAIKNFGKRQIASADSALPAEVCMVLYMLAISVALCRCGKLISTSSRGQLQDRLSAVARQAWIDEDVRQCIAAAEQALRAGP